MADSTLQLLNRVLRGLRRDEIADGTTTLTEDYHKTLLDFINVAKEEVEEAWDWEELLTTVTVTQTAAANVDISLISAGQADADVTNRARLLYENQQYQWVLRSTRNKKPQAFDITDGTEYRLEEVSVAKILRMRATDNDPTGKPCYFALKDTSDGYKTLMVYPQPTAVRTFVLDFILPQAELADTSVDSTTLTVPSRPVWTRALYYANEERGEELGRPGSSLDRQARDALANAIGLQMTDEDLTGYPE